jgi:hypothetical protein
MSSDEQECPENTIDIHRCLIIQRGQKRYSYKRSKMSIEAQRDSECVKKYKEYKKCLRKSGKIQT